ncbi:MAG: sigma-70 family RNA polymerase sigma factor [Planctomycetes bacterium]|nr:sigma-70 family RNA polymerase sigma factor [Planctomycetota bacterium]
MTDNHKPSRSDPVDDVVRAARTSRDAFGQLFDHFYPSIFAYCSRRLLVRAVAEDVTSDVFLKVVARTGDFAGTCTEDFRRWLFRIATNEINAHLRQSIRRRELLEAAARMGKIDAAVSTSLLAQETPVEWEEVYQALSELSDREQSIISLRFFAGFKHDQIADVLNIETGTVRVALNRALNKLRDRLRDPEALRRTAPGTRGGN